MRGKNGKDARLRRDALCAMRAAQQSRRSGRLGTGGRGVFIPGWIRGEKDGFDSGTDFVPV